ncbi:hypothetical protein [Paenibacillus silviterrae]|uniref:hypothetical protein n=1 Tax=Paenibacillus silviterrae TaxID=3242194 RepID=UPI0025431F6B|nr:hypothetical protein [Paenibacillus chinjuensis]
MSPSIIVLFVLAMWFNIMAIAFALFRIPMLRYKREVTISIILLSVVSVVIQLNKWFIVTGIVQPFLLFLCLLMIFRFNWQHSLLVSQFGYVVSGLFEPVSAMLLSNFHFHEAIQVWKQENSILAVLLLKTALQLTFFLILRRMRIGFTFVQPATKSLLRLTASTRLALGLFICASLSVSLSLFLRNALVLYVICGILFLLLIFLYIAYQREMVEE